MSEERFERRLRLLLGNRGFSVINIPRYIGGHVCDLVAMKDMMCFPIEVKGRKTRYDEEQELTQVQFFTRSKSPFFVIKQSKKRGRMKIWCPNARHVRGHDHMQAILEWAIKEFLE